MLKQCPPPPIWLPPFCFPDYFNLNYLECVWSPEMFRNKSTKLELWFVWRLLWFVCPFVLLSTPPHPPPNNWRWFPGSGSCHEWFLINLFSSLPLHLPPFLSLPYPVIFPIFSSPLCAPPSSPNHPLQKLKRLIPDEVGFSQRVTHTFVLDSFIRRRSVSINHLSTIERASRHRSSRKPYELHVCSMLHVHALKKHADGNSDTMTCDVFMYLKLAASRIIWLIVIHRS